MNSKAVVGICSSVIGVMLAVDGYTAHPQRWFLFAAGALFIAGGIIRLAKSRRVPTAG